MCRFAAYSGPSDLISTLAISEPNSLRRQSLDASEGKTRTNGDGFGFGWFGNDGGCYSFRDSLPAWGDENFVSIAQSISAEVFFIHCRAATGTDTSRLNCHPFNVRNNLFMHNGQIGGYERIRRKIETLIPDDLYSGRRGSSDSEAIFLASLGRIEQLGVVRALESVLADIADVQRAANIRAPLRFSACWTEGATIWAFRWASDKKAPTLYFRESFNAVVLASEPTDDDRSRWTAVEHGQSICVTNGKIDRIETFNPSEKQN